MRMWLCDPKILCQKHLCGEHVEMHMFLGTLKKQRKIDGFLNNNLFQPRLLFQRHEDLKEEMIRRGYNHNSCMEECDCACVEDLPDEKKYWEVNRESALTDLLERCPQCRERYESMK
jgi:hypothetical protein